MLIPALLFAKRYALPEITFSDTTIMAMYGGNSVDATEEESALLDKAKERLVPVIMKGQLGDLSMAVVMNLRLILIGTLEVNAYVGETIDGTELIATQRLPNKDGWVFAFRHLEST